VLQIKLIKSPIGTSKTKKRTVKALGLKRINDSVIQPDNPAIRGMINRISELIHVEEIDGNRTE